MLWSKTLETGIPKIDEQHQELFRQADFLLDRSKADKVEATLKFLKDYVAKHFFDEEAFHRASQYPKAEPHKQLHVEFSGGLKKQLEEYFKATNKSASILTINSMVTGWLRDHIMRHDKEFATYYIQKQQR
ncbi:MAG: hemerythrin family protein [Deltaproteobacteria bacterium]|jgi:hemerythrin-like metal-binding protein|nr:hemerythrin family protein [Deltaproteobacteria bacterium]